MVRFELEGADINTLVKALVEKIDTQEKVIHNLRLADKIYSDAQDRKFSMLWKALGMTEGQTIDFKVGDIVTDGSTIYCLSDVRKNHMYAAAGLFDYVCDNEYEFTMEIAEVDGIIDVDEPELLYASNNEVHLFTYMLQKRGYTIDDSGKVVKIK